MDDPERESSDRSVASPLDRVRESLLPGMESEVLPAPVPDDWVDRYPRHTAERLLELHPDRYALAVALFFGCPTISGRQVCRIARIGPHTLAELIRREEAGRTAAEWARSASARLRALADVAMSVAGDLMSDADAVREAGLKGVASILRESTHAHALLDGRLPGQQPKQSADGADDYLESVRRAQAESISGEEIEGARAEEEPGSGAEPEQDGGAKDD
jgi:hypothetical protein